MEILHYSIGLTLHMKLCLTDNVGIQDYSIGLTFQIKLIDAAIYLKPTGVKFGIRHIKLCRYIKLCPVYFLRTPRTPIGLLRM